MEDKQLEAVKVLNAIEETYQEVIQEHQGSSPEVHAKNFEDKLKKKLGL